MRFTCYKTIVTKIFDALIEDSNDILNVLQSIKNKEITCTLKIQGSTYNNVRILNIDNSCFTWRFLKGRASLQKISDITSIESLEINTDDDIMIKLKPQATRWSTLDTEAI